MSVVAVIDTSVLVSNYNREHLITAAYEHLYRPIWSPWMIAELNRVMTWNWIKNKGGLMERSQLSRRCKDMMTQLVAAFESIDPKPPWQQAWPKLTDQDDLPIWNTALFVNATHIISANTKDFPPVNRTGQHIWGGIEYIQVDDFLSIIGYEV